MTKFEDINKALKGKAITKVTGYEENSETLRFHIAGDWVYTQGHVQDCCESVAIAQVDGDISKHIGALILNIEEKVVDISDTEGVSDSGTATFYTMTTTKGRLDWRWTGESNGYYSEWVDHEYIAHPMKKLLTKKVSLERQLEDVKRSIGEWDE